MDSFFNLGFLRMLEHLRCPVLDVLMQAITYCGQELVFLAVAVIVLWCVDKRRGYYLLIVGFFGTIVNQFLKVFFRIPRPWVKDPSFHAVESAKAGATGYSFPSGHTQNAIATFGGIGFSSRKRLIRVAAPIFGLLIAFSRLYLGCHTLMDVAVSLVFASILVIAFWPFFRNLYKHPQAIYPIFAVMLAMAIAFLVYLKCNRLPRDENYYAALKNGYSLLGALLAFFLVYPIEQKYIRFSESAPLLGQLLKVALGLGIIIGVKSGLKPLLGLIFPNVLWTNSVRYFVIVLIAGIFWPMTFPFWKKVGQRKGE